MKIRSAGFQIQIRLMDKLTENTTLLAEAKINTQTLLIISVKYKKKKPTNIKTHTKILTQSNTPNTRELTKVKVQTFNFSKHLYFTFLDSECIFLVFEEHTANSEI